MITIEHSLTDKVASVQDNYWEQGDGNPVKEPKRNSRDLKKKKKVTEMKSASRFINRLGIAEERLSVLETVSEDSSKSKENKNPELNNYRTTTKR